MPENNSSPKYFSLYSTYKSNYLNIQQLNLAKLLLMKNFSVWLKNTVLTLFIALLASSALAQTNVSGNISSNTHWTLNDSPYVISGDVVIANSAQLTIDAGVTVYMAANANLSVNSASIKALGTEKNPINVLSDKTRNGQTAAPGDWKQWVFNAGSSGTQLDYVIFKNGKGLAVNSSAPIFNYLQLINNQGAAISIDLAASPSGIGNQASGNSINGVLVPAGDITGSVKWALLGIPYVVDSGVLSVGKSPTISAISPKTLQQGDSATFAISGTRLTGLSSASFDKAGISAKILAGASDTQVSLSISSDASAKAGDVSLKLLTDAGEVQLAKALSIIESQAVISSLNPDHIYLGSGTLDVLINGSKISDKSVAQVNGSNVATQFISSTQAKASITTPSAAGNLKIRLQTPDPINAGQFLTSNELTLSVISKPYLAFSESDFNVNKGFTGSDIGKGKATLHISLMKDGHNYVTDKPVTIKLSSTNKTQTKVTIPDSITIAAGSYYATFDVTGVDLTNGTPVEISATANNIDYADPASNLAVNVLPTKFNFIGISQNLAYGIKNKFYLALDNTGSGTQFAAADLPVNLSIESESPANIVAGIYDSDTNGSLISQIKIKKGATQSDTVYIDAASADGTYTVRANPLADNTNSTTSLVTVHSRSFSLPDSALVAPGLTSSIPLLLSDPAPVGGLVINLQSQDPTIASLSAKSITIPAGESSANFNLNGVSAGSTNISASATGYKTATLPVKVKAVTIGIGKPAVNTISILEGFTKSFDITLSSPAPAGGKTINLAIDDSTKASVTPSSIKIAEGETSGGVTLATVTAIAEGSVNLTAKTDGLNTVSVPVTVTPKAQLTFKTGLANTSVVVGKGFTSYDYEVEIHRQVNGKDFNGVDALTVNLKCESTSVCSVPATVTIPANSSYAYVLVSGNNIGSTVISASATGYSSPTDLVKVSVVAPVFTLNFSNTQVGIGSVRNTLNLSASIPGGGHYSSDQTATADIPIKLSIAATPAGIVDGIYYAQTAGTKTTQVIFKKGSNAYYSKLVAYVASPTASGTYQIKASADSVNAAEVSSPEVTVSGGQLTFKTGLANTSVVVGKGFTSYDYEVEIHRQVNGKDFNGVDALTVNLKCESTSVCSVPAMVTIPANSSYAYVLVSGNNIGSTVISASATGYSSPTDLVKVSVVAPVFTLNFSNTQVGIGSVRNTLNLSASIPGGGHYSSDQTATADIPIKLSIAATPAGIVDGIYYAQTAGTKTTQVIFKKGSNAYYSKLVAYVASPTASGTYQIKASADSVNAAEVSSPEVTVSGGQLTFKTGLANTSVVVGKGFTSYDYEVEIHRQANGTDFNGVDALTVNLKCESTSVCSVPATVTIPANSSYVYVPVSGNNIGSTSISASASATGYSSPTTTVNVSVVAPVFTLNFSNTQVGIGSVRNTLNLTDSIPGGGYYSRYQEATNDIPIKLSLAATPAGIVDGMYDAKTAGTKTTQVIFAKGSYAYYSKSVAYVASPTASGTYQIKASADSVNAAEVSSPEVTVSGGQLTFKTELANTSVVVGKGFTSDTNEVEIYRQANGTDFNGVDALTVNLKCESTSICSVPATVTIPANSSYVYVPVSGNNIGSTSISASATGYSSPTTPVNVSVVAPVFTLNFSNTQVGIGSVRNTLNLTDSIPGGGYDSRYQEATNDIPIKLSLAATPAGIVDGMYDAKTAGTKTTQFIFAKGSSAYYSKSAAYVASPTASGTYQIKASADSVNAAEVSSPEVTVSGGQLTFKTGLANTSVVVGKGFTTTSSYDLAIYRQANGTDFDGVDALTVNLKCESTSVCSVPATVTIPANSSYVYVPVSGNNLGSTVISASATGYSSPTDLVKVSVVAPVFTLNFSNTQVGIGSVRNTLNLSASIPGASTYSYQTANADIPIKLSLAATPAGIVDGIYDAQTAGTKTTRVILAKGSNYSKAYIASPTASGTYQIKASADSVNAAEVSSPEITVNP